MTSPEQTARARADRRYTKGQLTALVALRWLIGWHLLYEGVAKLLNPYWTSADYLSQSTWWLSGLFRAMAANPTTLAVVDFLNTWGLILIGLGLVAGFLTRTATASGAVLLLLYYIANPPFVGTPTLLPAEGSYVIVNKTLIEFVGLVILLVLPTGHLIGLDRLLHRRWPGRGFAELKAEAEPGTPVIGRRDLLSALASIPVLGVFVYNVLEKKARDDVRRRVILGELGISERGPAFVPEAISRSPGDAIRVGVIGFGGEGESLARHAGFAHPDWVEEMRQAAADDPSNTRLKGFMEQEDLNIVVTGICDVFDVRAERGLAAAQCDVGPAAGRSLPSAKRYRDYRELLASDDVDAVIIATPDHWHSRMAIDAITAGKHVYLEKCMTRTADEAIALANAVRGSNIVFQLGHQNRQAESHMKAREVIEKEILGPITLVETTTNRNDPWGAWVWEIHEQGNPDTIDWERFEGPAAHKVPFNLERFFRWRCWFDYGTGLSGDLLSHEYDAVNQILHLGIPASVVSSGGIYFFKDGRDVPDVFQAVMEYPDRDLTLVYSATLANGNNRGVVFMGHDASMRVGTGLTVTADGSSTRYKERIEERTIDPSRPMFTYQPGFKGVDAVTSATEEYFVSRGLLFTYRGGRRVSAYHLHIKEWLDVIRNGGKTSCNIDRGFEEAITCHMATESYLRGRRVSWDPVRQRIV